MPLANIPNAPGQCLWTNCLSYFWIEEIRESGGLRCSSIPKFAVLASAGAVGYSLSLPGRVLNLAISIIGLMKDFVQLLCSRNFAQFAPKMKEKTIIVLGAFGEVVSAVIGCTGIGVPLAYMIDEWIQANPIILSSSNCDGGWWNSESGQSRQGRGVIGDAIHRVFGGNQPANDPDLERALYSSANDTGGAAPSAPTDDEMNKYISTKKTLYRFFIVDFIESYDNAVFDAFFRISFLEQLVTGSGGLNDELEKSWKNLIENRNFQCFNSGTEVEFKLTLHDFLLKALILRSEEANAPEAEKVLIPSVKTQITSDLAKLNDNQRGQIEKIISALLAYSAARSLENRPEANRILQAVFQPKNQ